MMSLVHRSRRFLVAALAVSVCSAVLVSAQAITVGGTGVNPSDFRITTFKTGLNFPYGIQLLSDGSMLVATSRPNDPSDLFGYVDSSVGELIRLVDSNGDGVADGTTVVYSGLPGVVTGLAIAGDLVFATSSASGQEQIAVLRMGAAPTASLSFLGALSFSFPQNWEHTTYGLKARTIRAHPPTHELFFNVGSDANDAQSTATVVLSGLMSGTLQGASIYKVTITEQGNTISASGLTRIASGLRNATGMAFHPLSGDFYASDNGIDGLSNPEDALSTDEMNLIAATAVGGVVEDFGFPDSYTAYRGGPVGNTGIQPIAAFQPTLDGESKGSTQVSMAPPYFPAAVSNGMFIGFHGDTDQTSGGTVANAVVYLDIGTGNYFHFISSPQPGIGHPDGLTASDDSLFVADLSTSGFLGGLGTGVIYQIKAKPDLTISALSPPLSAKRGAQISITDTTANQGGGAGGSQTAFYLSSNQSRVVGVPLGARVVAPLAAGSVSTGTTKVTIPANTVPGAYFIVANADNGGAVDERDETNNTLSVSITIGK